MTQDEKQVEALAAYVHEAWSGWMKYLFGKTEQNNDGTHTIPIWAVMRWSRQMSAHYHELPESEKESGRDEARKMIAIFEDEL